MVGQGHVNSEPCEFILRRSHIQCVLLRVYECLVCVRACVSVSVCVRASVPLCVCVCVCARARVFVCVCVACIQVKTAVFVLLFFLPK